MGDLLKVLVFYKLVNPNYIQTRFNINCFVHHDKNPSMTVDLEKNTYYCHACGAYGGHINAISEIEGCSELEATLIFLKIKRDEYVTSLTNNLNLHYRPRVPFWKGIKSAKFYFEKSIPVDWHIEDHDYMFKRGFTANTLNETNIRMTYDSKYKIVCPITENGHFRGYVKRRTDGVDSVRKYLFNEGFKNSITMQGNYYKDWVVVTEGYMDWLKLKQAGFSNSVAILKWKASKMQIKKLQRVTDRVISALDNSDTGEDGTEILKQHFKHVVRFPFPFISKDCGDMNDIDFKLAKGELLKLICKYD